MIDEISKTVDAILDRVIASELISPNGFGGCSDSQLDAFVRFVNLPIPATYRRVMQRCGHFDGWTFLNPPARSTESASYWAALHLNAMVRSSSPAWNGSDRIPDDWLVFRRIAHPDFRFHCLDTKLGDDPPVLEIVGDFQGDLIGKPVQIAERFTDYLSLWVDEGINLRKAQLAFQTAISRVPHSIDFTGPYAQIMAFLANIKRRPSTYVPGLQLVTLETLLHGFEAGLNSQLQNVGKSFSLAFSEFILERRGWSGCSGWSVAIQEHVHHHERAWETFFELVEEFYASKQI